jgi:hypothetical protein
MGVILFIVNRSIGMAFDLPHAMIFKGNERTDRIYFRTARLFICDIIENIIPQKNEPITRQSGSCIRKFGICIAHNIDRPRRRGTKTIKRTNKNTTNQVNRHSKTVIKTQRSGATLGATNLSSSLGCSCPHAHRL